MVKFWEFYYENFKISIQFIVFGAIGVLILILLKQRYSVDRVLENILISVFSAFFIVAIFNIVYEIRIRESFANILSKINPNIASGVIVHPSHYSIKPRDESIQEYLYPNNIVRIMTSTADNYIKTGEPPRRILEEKINRYDCEVRILLYFPVFESKSKSNLGQRNKKPQNIINEHRSLKDDYESFVNINPERVIIKFFTITLHTNFIMIGNERMFSAPILHKTSGRELPCYELYPTGDDSVFYKFQRDFDYVFGNEDKKMVINYNQIFDIYENSNYDFLTIRQNFIG